MPIAVPVSCSQYVSEKEKILCVITHSSTCRKNSCGKFSGILFKLVVKKSLMVEIPISVLMFVYIETASAVKISALLGSMISFRPSMMFSEFFTCDCIRGMSSFILKSIHVEKTASRLPEVLTTGRRDMGSLWTFGSP